MAGFDTPFNWLLVCAQCRSLVFAHTRGSGLYIVFFPSVQLLGNCLYALEFPSADGNGSEQPTHPTSPLSSELPFCFSRAALLRSLTCLSES